MNASWTNDSAKEMYQQHNFNSTQNMTYMAQDEEDIMELASSYLMYKIGIGINKYYFPVIVPVGIIGNIFSFMVMIQPHNRHLSISLYIACLAVTDTISLLIGFTTHLNSVYLVDFPPDQHWYCAIATVVLWCHTMSGTLFILSMTFDRFYSIIRPLRAASFNTIKRTRITIVCIIIIGIIFNVPYLFMVTNEDRNCVPDQSTTLKNFYMWFSYIIVQFLIPFIALLTMNSVIIHTVRKRPVLGDTTEMKPHGQGQSQGQGQGQSSSTAKISSTKSSEKQIYIILILVAFSYLILISPLYVLFVYMTFADYSSTPYSIAAFTLLYNVVHKLYYTNNAINFFLYVVSGRKFRRDLTHLFKRRHKKQTSTSLTSFSEVNTISSTAN